MQIPFTEFGPFSFRIWGPVAITVVLIAYQVWGATSWRRPYRHYIYVPLLAAVVAALIAFLIPRTSYATLIMVFAVIALLGSSAALGLMHPRILVKLAGLILASTLILPVSIIQGQDLEARRASQKSLDHAMQCSSLMDGGCYWGDHMHDKASRLAFATEFNAFVAKKGFSPSDCFVPDVDVAAQAIMCQNDAKELVIVAPLAQALGVLKPLPSPSEKKEPTTVPGLGSVAKQPADAESALLDKARDVNDAPTAPATAQAPVYKDGITIENWQLCVDHSQSSFHHLRNGHRELSYNIPRIDFSQKGCGAPLQLVVRAGNPHATLSWMHEVLTQPYTPPPVTKKEPDKQKASNEEKPTPVYFNHPQHGKYVCVGRVCSPVRE